MDDLTKVQVPLGTKERDYDRGLSIMGPIIIGVLCAIAVTMLYYGV